MISGNLLQIFLYASLYHEYKNDFFVTILLFKYYGFSLNNNNTIFIKDFKKSFITDSSFKFFDVFVKKHNFTVSIVKNETLNQIGLDVGLTKERVRQLVFKGVYELGQDYNISPYIINKTMFKKIKNASYQYQNFLSLDYLLLKSFYCDFYYNPKGLINIFNHSGLNHVVYRNKYYIYENNINKEDVLNEIKVVNKKLRQEKLLQKRNKEKLVITYVPYYIKDILSLESNYWNSLNELYMYILNNFIEKKPYKKQSYFFNKEQDWRKPKVKKAWCQKNLILPKSFVLEIEKHAELENTSRMNFIGCALAWHVLKDKQIEYIKKY